MKTPTQISTDVKVKQEWSAPQLELIYTDQTNTASIVGATEDEVNHPSFV